MYEGRVSMLGVLVGFICSIIIFSLNETLGTEISSVYPQR